MSPVNDFVVFRADREIEQIMQRLEQSAFTCPECASGEWTLAAPGGVLCKGCGWSGSYDEHVDHRDLHTMLSDAFEKAEYWHREAAIATKDYDAKAKALKQAEKELRDRRQILEDRSQRLKDALLLTLGDDEIECPERGLVHLKLTGCKKSVELRPGHTVEEVPVQWHKIPKLEPQIDKNKLYAHLADEKHEVAGVELVGGKYVNIK